MAQQPKTPFLEVKGSFALDVVLQGESLVDSNGKFNFVLTEENVEEVLAAAQPQLIELLNKVAPSLLEVAIPLLMKELAKNTAKQPNLDDFLRARR